MQRLSFKSSAGYTFIELLLAITILALLIAPLLALFATAFKAITLAGQQTTAVNLCRAGIESLKSRDYEAVYGDYRAGGPVLEDGPVEEAPLFRRKIEVEPVTLPAGPASPELELLQLTVTVSWTARGSQQSFSAETYMSPRVTDPTSPPPGAD